jgi:hypothetical protein
VNQDGDAAQSVLNSFEGSGGLGARFELSWSWHNFGR